MLMEFLWPGVQTSKGPKKRKSTSAKETKKAERQPGGPLKVSAQTKQKRRLSKSAQVFAWSCARLTFWKRMFKPCSGIALHQNCSCGVFVCRVGP